MTPAYNLITHALRIGAIELLDDADALNGNCPYVVHAAALAKHPDSLPFLVRAYAVCAKTNGTILFSKGVRAQGFAQAVAAAAMSEHHVLVGHASEMSGAVDCVDAQSVRHDTLRGMRVVVLDSYETTCANLLSAVTYVEEERGILFGIVVLFDRQECTSPSSTSSLVELWSDYFGVPVCAAASLRDLAAVLRDDDGVRYPRGPSVLKAIHARIGTRVRW